MRKHREPTTAALALMLAALLFMLVGAILNLGNVHNLSAEPDVLSVHEECQQALGYPGRSEADQAWLNQCVSALTPPTVEPTPSPTPSSPPSPTAAPTTPPATTPAPATGWPGAGNTGIPAGTVLTPYTGPGTITIGGTVINSKTIGCLTVRAANVVIRNSRLNCASHPVGGLILNGTNTLVEDTELVGGVGNPGCVTGSNYLLRRVNIHGCTDGAWMLGNATIADSWIHDLGTCSGCHDDGIQSTGGTNLTIRHNRIDLNMTQTGCIKLGAEQFPLRDVVVENNLLNGGGYSLYAGGSGSNVSGIHIRSNRWLRSPVGYFPNGGFFGPVAFFEAKAGSEWIGNAWLDNGTAIVP